jgi:hypothetical protein
MKKIRLDLDSLSIESFDTTGAADARGTVAGHATYQAYCSYGLTCVDSCEGTCDGSCVSECGTCGATGCGSCGATYCGTCVDPSCCPTYCGTCYDWTCDPDCCCTCSCY